MKNWIRIATLVIALGSTAGLSGCVVSSSGTPTGTTYMLGHLDGTLPSTPPKIVEAAVSVLEELGMKGAGGVSTALDGKVQAETALAKKIEITVQRQDEGSSKVSIRVGSFGDHKISVDLFEKIKAKLQ